MKCINEVELLNKKVIVRCDFNVPMENGEITDNTRIIKSLDTINYLLDNNCGIILMSHMGRVKVSEDKKKYSLKVVSEELASLLNKEVKFISSPVGMEVIKACANLKFGEILLLENTRFCDFPEKLESKNDLELSKYWSTLADAFVLDAFGSMHRAHASVAGISKYLPTYSGLLVQNELFNLRPVIENVNRPFGVFMGGAKVDDKLGYIKNLLTKCDFLCLGGGIANSFLYACGFDVKESLCTSDEITLEELRQLVKEYKDKIVMPIDFVIDDNKILDLGNKTIEKYIKKFSGCKTIFVNGTCGKFEDNKYANGTICLFNELKNIDAYKVAGGGDTLNAIRKYNLAENFTYLSSGGGASLEYVSTGKLQALEYIQSQNR